jgi:NTP pyrophosphatase (non-canonical NTP hydrolase)
MDIAALQARLRAFAAQRQWQPFHTPKNLSMALMVEAAELMELFQWLTPEQSQASATDPALQTRIGEELADVLLYLLQLADHTGVDLQAAVEDKLLKNAIKHPVPQAAQAKVIPSSPCSAAA